MGFSEKLCSWIKRKNRRFKKAQPDKEAPTDEVNRLMDHIYEEIPDVIPVGWRDVRSDSMSAFFLVATAGVSEDSFKTCYTDTMIADGDSELDRNNMTCGKVSLSDSCSCEPPQNCLPSPAETHEYVRQTTLSHLFMPYSTGDIRRKCHSQVKENSSPKCARSRLSCVRAKCNHSDLISGKRGSTGKDSKVSFHSFAGIGPNKYHPDSTPSKPCCSISEPVWKKICDDIFSELLSPCLETDTKPVSAFTCTVNRIGDNPSIPRAQIETNLRRSDDKKL